MDNAGVTNISAHLLWGWGHGCQSRSYQDHLAHKLWKPAAQRTHRSSNTPQFLESRIYRKLIFEGTHFPLPWLWEEGQLFQIPTIWVHPANHAMHDVCSLIQGGASTVPISTVMSFANALQLDRTKEPKRAQVASPKQAESFLEGNPLFWMALKLQTLENATLSVGLVFQLWGSTTKISWRSKQIFGTPAGTRYSWAIWSMVSSRPETGKMLRSGSFARPTTETFAGAICLHSRWFGDQKKLTCLAFSPWAPEKFEGVQSPKLRMKKGSKRSLLSTPMDIYWICRLWRI